MFRIDGKPVFSVLYSYANALFISNYTKLTNKKIYYVTSLFVSNLYKLQFTSRTHGHIIGALCYTWLKRGTMRVKWAAQEDTTVPEPGLELACTA